MSCELTPNDLLQVLKPAQYMGAELGAVKKDPSAVDFRFCLAFPDTYEVGMSHVGMQILYDLINRDPKSWAERVYVPQPDMEKLLREKKAKLSSLESKFPLHKFDVVGFSLQYELCGTGILTILDLGDIPLLAKDRSEEHPLIIGGGPVTYHPEPFSDFFDAFLVGDGEELVPEFINAVRSAKAKGHSRKQILDQVTEIEGIYVPSFFEALYDDKGEFSGMRALKESYTSVKRRVLSSLVGAPYPVKPVVPSIEAVHDRLSVEVMRGCVRGCRFCQAGYLYRPQRERSPEDVLRIVEQSLDNTGYEELSLLSLSTADYCSVIPLISSIKERFAQNDQLAVSFPSTRVDALKPELLQEVQAVRRSGFTIAPEAGTQRMRDVINKGVTDEQILETCSNVFRLGWNSVKMYFMLGLPTETPQDLDGIIDIGSRVRAIAGRSRDVTVSVSTLVPKPHTPFQWARQIGEKETLEAQARLHRGAKRAKVNFRYHYAFSTFLEGVFARGDRKLSAVILKAYELGARLEGWSENLAKEMWLKSFDICGIDPHPYLNERDIEAALPWDHISCDIPKSYFLKEWKRALSVRTTPDCLTESCSICGACDYDAVRNELFDANRTRTRLNILTNDPVIVSAKEPITEKAAIKKERAGGYSLKEYLRTEVDSTAEDSPEFGRQPALPVLQRLRLSFRKVADARFYSHFELKSIFFRAMRRGKIPLAFSRGFNPKPKIMFGPPLQLGIESEAELVDLYLTASYLETEIDSVFIEYLNTLLPPGIEVVSAKEIDPKAAPIQNVIRSMEYRARLADSSPVVAPQISENWPSKSAVKVRKGRTESVILGNFIERVSTNQRDIIFEIPFSNSAASIKPSEVLDALTEIPSEHFELRKIAAAMTT